METRRRNQQWGEGKQIDRRKKEIKSNGGKSNEKKVSGNHNKKKEK